MRGPLIATYMLITDVSARWLIVRDVQSPSGWRLPGRVLAEDDDSPEAAVAQATAEQTGLQLAVTSLLTVKWLAAGGCLAMVFGSPVIAAGASSIEEPDDLGDAACRLVPAEVALAHLHPLLAQPLSDISAHGPISYFASRGAPGAVTGPADRTTRTAARVTRTGTTIVSTYPCCWRTGAKLLPRDIAELAVAHAKPLERTCLSCGTLYQVRIIGSATQPEALEWEARR